MNTYESDGAEQIGLKAAPPVVWIIVCDPVDRSQGTVVQHHTIELAPLGHGQIYSLFPKRVVGQITGEDLHLVIWVVRFDFFELFFAPGDNDEL